MTWIMIVPAFTKIAMTELFPLKSSVFFVTVSYFILAL